MIVRLMVIDPNPQPTRSDVLVYQVPEKSREMELLIQLFDQARLEWEVVEFSGRRKPLVDKRTK